MLLAVVVAACTFSACDDDEVISLKAESETLSFVSEGETKTVAVTAQNVSWTASTEDGWLTLADNTGTGNGTLTVTAAPNYLKTELTGSITISGSGTTPVVIRVTQAADTTPRSLTTEVTALSFTCGDYDPYFLSVTAENVAWEVAADADWVHVEKSVDADSQSGVVKVTVDKNSGTARKANITLSGPGVEPVVLAVAQKEVFASDIIGAYKPALKYWDALSAEAGDLFLDTEWTTGMGPKIPVNIPGLFPNGVDWMMVDYMLLPMVGAIYSQGLDSFTFRDDGTFAATYHAMEGDFMNPKFDPAISSYPTDETLATLPGGVLSYYTDKGLFYVSVDKAFLTRVGLASLGVDLCLAIDEIIGMYSGLSLVSTPEYYALPFKYSLTSGGVLTLHVDREMMMPYKPLLKEIIPLVLSMNLIPAEELASLGIDPSNPKPLVDFIETLFSTSTKLDLGIRLAKK